MRSTRPLSAITFGPTTAPAGQVQFIVDGDHFQQVVLDGVLKARVSLDIATADFKAMMVPDSRGKRARSIVTVLRDLAGQGVETRLLHSGVPSRFVLRELREHLPERITIRRCPRLHAKAIIVDCRAMYLGSANLTGAGLGAKSDARRNFEMGIWTHSPELIDAVLERFNTLWEGRSCGTCGRRDVCPVPLEEPDLG